METCQAFYINSNISLLCAWDFYLGVSFQMSPHRDWFVKYQPYIGRVVYLGNDHPLEIMGRGDIKIKFDDGIERKLCYVWHVLDLQKNLLAKLGYSTTFGDNRCKITKGYLVVSKGESYQTLYYLCNDAVTCHVATKKVRECFGCNAIVASKTWTYK